ncbi:MAG: hypothetical protein ACLQD8_07255 [Thermoplasmata archaeon]
MSGPGGVGPLPSSRLTRILQEKAEALRKRRQTAEVALKEAEERVGQLDRLGISPAGAAERLQQLHELVRRSDWDQVETSAQALLAELAAAVPGLLEERRVRTGESLGRLTGLGIPIPPELATELEALARPAAGGPWTDSLVRLMKVEDGIRHAATAYLEGVRGRAISVARWSGLGPERLAEFERLLPNTVDTTRDDALADAVTTVQRNLVDGLPEAAERHRTVRENAERLRATAEELGAVTGPLDAALRDDAAAPIDRWPETVAAIDAAIPEVGEGLRERSRQVLEGLRGSLGTVAEFEVDAAGAVAAVESALARLPATGPLEITGLLAEARAAAEEPIVTVVAGLLDEVRPRIAGARRLGRDPSEVFSAMNRAREALRLKIYSEALAAAQEALDRVSGLTEDLDAARGELGTLQEMLLKFRAAGFPTEPFDAPVARVRALLDRADVPAARQALQEAVHLAGKEALRFFVDRWATLDKTRAYAHEHGFVSPETEQVLGEARALLDAGDLGGAAELLARFEVELRSSAGPYVARRVEEMEKAFVEITDGALTAPVRRLLADADVTLRVKQDVVGSVESLHRAEREFSAVFGAHASALVEGLESEVRVLSSMGGTSDEIQRQIDEVQQIFNMGDFVQASRASQEIRTRARQQQLLRSDEAISHAKLALVELEPMGLDLTSLRPLLDDAQSAARENRYLDAYRTATELEEAAGRGRAAAQTVVERISRLQDQLGRLHASGADPSPFYEGLREGREQLNALRFDRARTLLDDLDGRISAEAARIETERLLGEVGLLVEEGRQLGAPVEPMVRRLEGLQTERHTAAPEATRTGSVLLHDEILAVLRPILEENLRSLERDLDIARSAGVPLDKIVPPLAEARRRVALPVPTGAAALIDEVRSALISTRGFVEHAERAAKRVHEALAQADLLRVEVGELRARAERFDTFLAGREYVRVVELAGPLERELHQATYRHVSKTLAGFQATVTQLRRDGANTSVAENLLHQARMSLDEGRPLDSIQLAARSERELERADLQHKLAEGSIEAAERAIAGALAEGAVATEAQDSLRSAKSSYVKGSYADVFERMIFISDLVATVRDGLRRAREAIAVADRQLTEAKGLGAEAADATGELAEARHELDAGHYSPSVRRAREATEMARWAIDRAFAAPLGELRRQVDAVRAEGMAGELEPLEALVTGAEAAARAHQWTEARGMILQAEDAARRLFEETLDGRWREVEADAKETGPVSPSETARRADVARKLGELRSSRDVGGALRLVHEELEIVRGQRKEVVLRAVAALRDRLWVGERLGVDTTPAMQTFGEARASAEAGRLGEATELLARSGAALAEAVRGPLARRRKELASEVTFAEEGLHVSVGSVKEELRAADELLGAGRLLDGGAKLLKIEEDLNLRKSLHRELTNLHFLIDAALGRAEERQIDTSRARALLDESLRLRPVDYPGALQKAREALKLLQADGVVIGETAATAAPSSTPFWPFRRPPPS